jgi:hypothetical protein
MESDAVPGAALRARFRESVVETRSDRRGYFFLEIRDEAAPGWISVDLELVG